MKLITSFFESDQDFIKASAEYILTEALSNIKEKGYFTIVLTGGTTPIKIYENLASSPLKEKFPWTKTYFFLSDERILLPENPQSNIYMLYESLFSNADIPNENIILPDTNLNNPEEIAKDYEFKIKKIFKKGKPTFDLILLGMGLDFHTASLFPKDPIWQNSKDLVISTSNPIGFPKVHRVSIGLPLINQSKNILMLISGVGKRAVAQKILAEIKENENSTNSPILEIFNFGEFIWYIN